MTCTTKAQGFAMAQSYANFALNLQNKNPPVIYFLMSIMTLFPWSGMECEIVKGNNGI